MGSRISKLLACLISSVACAQLLADDFPGQASPDAGDTRAAPHEQSFSAEIESILGIKDNDADVVPLIAEGLKNFSSNDAVGKAKSYNGLVDGLLKGPHPSALIDQILPTVSIDSSTAWQRQQIRDWQLGKYSERRAIIRDLWALAEKAQERNPGRASEIAKATLMLAALNDYYLGWVQLTVVLDENSAKVKNLLGISDAQFDRLKKAVQERQARQQNFFDRIIDTEELIDVYTRSPQRAIDPKNISLILAQLDGELKDAPSQDGYRWHVLTVTWDLLKLVDSRHDVTSDNLVRTQLKAWASRSSDAVKRWTDQALSTAGEPEVLVGEGVLRPNGKVEPTDTTPPK